MKAEKQRITKLISTMEERFPDTQDLFGYAGVSCSMLRSSLQESYKLLSLIENYKEHFEVVWFKREFSRLIDEEFQLLKEVDSKGWADKFNRFLHNIFQIRHHTKTLYLTLAKDPLRSDLELAELKESYSELKKKYTAIQETIQEIEAAGASLKEFETTSEEYLDKLDGFLEAVEPQKKKLDSLVAEIEEIEESTTESQSTVKVAEKLVQETLDKSNELLEANQKIDGQVRKNKKELDELVEKLRAQIAIDEKIQDSIKKTLADVNQYGLASAFQKRKNELRWSVLLWGTLTLISLSVLVYLSYEYAKGISGQGGLSDPFLYLLKLPTIIATVWLGWFCSKQFGFTIRIREDYAYKTAISMAFEGYKNETKAINEELLEQLIKVTILNISLNPIAIFDTKNNHGSPMNEFGEAIRQFLRIDAKVKTPIV